MRSEQVTSSQPLPDIARVVSFLQTLLAFQADALANWLTTIGLVDADTRWLAAQGLAPYAFFRLKELNLLGYLPDDVQRTLQIAYYGGAARNTVQRREATKIIIALADANVETVLLKGTPLSHTIYPAPLCRLKSDLDIWVQPDQLEAAISTLQGLGYQQHNKDSRPPTLVHLFGGEQQMVSSVLGTGPIELQWPAIRGEWVRHTVSVDHDGIWARRVLVDIDGQATYAMAPEDMLIHLCLHLAVNHQFGSPWLRWLLDIHLLLQEQSLDWGQVVARAQAWRLATVAWTVLDLAQGLLGTAVPNEALAALSPSPWRRWAIRQLELDRALVEMWPGGYQHRRFLILLLLVDRARDASRLLWRALFPETAWLRARYGAEPAGALWRARLMHPWQLLISTRS